MFGLVCLLLLFLLLLLFFFFNDTATTEIYTLSLHDALPISYQKTTRGWLSHPDVGRFRFETKQNSILLFFLFCEVISLSLLIAGKEIIGIWLAKIVKKLVNSYRSEEHTSELQSQSTISYAVFCLKKKKK